MEINSTKIIDEMLSCYPSLEQVKDKILKACELILCCYRKGGKVMICGNGGSASDSEHIAGEFLKGFLKKRPLDTEQSDKIDAYCKKLNINPIGRALQTGLPAISLVSQTSIISAVSNDQGEALTYAQQVNAYCNPGDILIAISTSGNALNCCYAAITAKSKGGTVISLTGEGGGRLKEISDITINVPRNSTPYIQELHLPVYHTICAVVEENMFSE